jgi:hypothetical protein
MGKMLSERDFKVRQIGSQEWKNRGRWENVAWERGEGEQGGVDMSTSFEWV